jgi:hypothetical protein
MLKVQELLYFPPPHCFPQEMHWHCLLMGVMALNFHTQTWAFKLSLQEDVFWFKTKSPKAKCRFLSNLLDEWTKKPQQHSTLSQLPSGSLFLRGPSLAQSKSHWVFCLDQTSESNCKKWINYKINQFFNVILEKISLTNNFFFASNVWIGCQKKEKERKKTV